MRLATIALFAFLFPSTAAFAQANGLGSTDGAPSLAEIARQLREKKQKDAPAPASDPKAETSAAPQPSSEPRTIENDELNYTIKVRVLLSQDNFTALEKVADTARTSKPRFAGGVWQLYVFYEAVTKPVSNDHARITDWQSVVAHLKRWETSMPESITAEVALAQAYLNLAWFARESGAVNSLSESGWSALDDSLGLSKSALQKAASMKDRCPQQYVVAQQLALAQRWDKEKTAALFEEAIAFEPDYYFYYREYAKYLQERWYGDEGEAVEFAAKVAAQVGGKKGAFLYFEIATVLNCHCGAETDLPKMSWITIKEGYAALEELYGTSLVAKNRFAYMAFREGDKAAAQKTFQQMKSNWNASVWGERQTFEAARTWAFTDNN